MATIKEMAALAFQTIAEEDKEAIDALKYIGIECDNVHEYNSVRLNQQYIYIMGANAVLDIIEECLEEPSMIQGYSDIMAVVQELKGE